MTEYGTSGPPEPLSRITVPLCVVLRALLRGRTFGLAIATATGLRPATAYGILDRLEQARWVASAWEDKDDPAEPADPGGRRKYYQLTDGGEQMARAALKLREHMFA
jgi:DNA-binding PadR family transcriptional regulator